jgi:hypothetical protein
MFESFYKKKEYTLDDLNSLIKNEIEESIHLDYKSSKSLDKADRKKTEIAKDISAFANSDGGIIIYGILEENHKPKEFSFVNGNIFNKEWLENIIDGNIQQRISGVEIHPIRVDNDIEKTIYIIKIPSSLNAPHLSSDKKYYRRFNFKSVPMEEYEIRLLYNRMSKSEIQFKTSWCKPLKNVLEDGHTSIGNEITIHVENISETLESNCKVEVYFTFGENEYIFSSYKYNQNRNIDYKILKQDKLKIPVISAYNTSPIFPNEESNMMRFEIYIKEHDYAKFWESGIMNIKVFSSNNVRTEKDKVNILFPKPL